MRLEGDPPLEDFDVPFEEPLRLEDDPPLDDLEAPFDEPLRLEDDPLFDDLEAPFDEPLFVFEELRLDEPFEALFLAAPFEDVLPAELLLAAFFVPVLLVDFAI